MSQDFLGLLQNLLIKREIPALKQKINKEIKEIIRFYVDQ